MFVDFFYELRKRKVPVATIGSWIPLALLIWDALTGNLTANPIQAATFRTGKTALVLLVAVHIIGVVMESRLHHENLVKAMFNGRKRS